MHSITMNHLSAGLIAAVVLFANRAFAHPQSLTARDAAWKPKAGDTWQIDIDKALSDSSINVAVYDIDLWYNDATTIKALHDAGRKVICYFSAGSYEPDRPDAGKFKPADLGSVMIGWEPEQWVNTKSQDIRDIMKARLDRAQTIGCDAVDPDNVDAFDNENSLGLNQDDAVDYVTFLTNEAHTRGMASGLKNAGDIIQKTNSAGTKILNLVDFSVNEECAEPSNDECEVFHPFITAGKPVFHIEYPTAAPNIPNPPPSDIVQTYCKANGEEGMSTVLKNMNLDAWMVPCPS